MKSRRHLLTPVFAALLLVPACNYANPHGYQKLPPIKRLVTEPRGATVFFERLNRTMETPCDIAEDVYGNEPIHVSKAGFLPYQGRLSDLPEVARGTRQCVLRKR